jgi:hypothetical protein
VLGESPRVMYMHVSAHGDPVKIAGTIHTALATTKTPLGVPERCMPEANLTCAHRERDRATRSVAGLRTRAPAHLRTRAPFSGTRIALPDEITRSLEIALFRSVQWRKTESTKPTMAPASRR